MTAFVLRGVKGMRLAAQLEKIPISHQKKRATADLSPRRPGVDKALQRKPLSALMTGSRLSLRNKRHRIPARGWPSAIPN